MGAAVGRTLVARGISVVSALDGRSRRTKERAKVAGIADVGSVEALVARATLVLSIVPPADALDVARRATEAARRSGTALVYLDANAVSPKTAGAIARLVANAGCRFVDSDLIGGPPGPARSPTRLYLSGDGAPAVAARFDGPELDAVVLGEGPQGVGGGGPLAASALKMCYAAWTKGSAALLLAIRALARAEGVEDALLAEWSRSQPDLAARCDAAAGTAGRAWRFVAEMEETGQTFASARLPDGFALAAAEVYRRLEPMAASTRSLDDVVATLRSTPSVDG